MNKYFKCESKRPGKYDRIWIYLQVKERCPYLRDGQDNPYNLS